MSVHRRTSARHRAGTTPRSTWTRAAVAVGAVALAGAALGSRSGPPRPAPVRAAETQVEPLVLPVDPTRAAPEPDPTTAAPAPTTDAPAPTTEAPAPTTEAPAPTTPAAAPTPASRAGGGRQQLAGTPQEYARDLLAQHGYAAGQYDCLDALWTRESGWDTHATNASSGAYGIPQALPGNKMADHGDDWQTNPQTQVRWGVDYIGERYGSPCGADQHSRSYGWY